MSLIKCYWMLQNARVTAFTISELLREKQMEKIKLLPPPRLMALTLSRNLNPLCKRTFIKKSRWYPKTDLKYSGTLKTVIPKTVTLKSSRFFDGP